VIPGVPVAFLQLKKHPRRLVMAVAGIAMSAMGILCQMGFEDSLFRSATRLFQEFDAELVVISPQYQFMVLPEQFMRDRWGGAPQAANMLGLDARTGQCCGVMRPERLSLPGHQLPATRCIGGQGTPTSASQDLPATTSSSRSA
jgi:hypothetical protein